MADTENGFSLTLMLTREYPSPLAVFFQFTWISGVGIFVKDGLSGVESEDASMYTGEPLWAKSVMGAES